MAQWNLDMLVGDVKGSIRLYFAPVRVIVRAFSKKWFDRSSGVQARGSMTEPDEERRELEDLWVKAVREFAELAHKQTKASK